jgi:hypothetical protein
MRLGDLEDLVDHRPRLGTETARFIASPLSVSMPSSVQPSWSRTSGRNRPSSHRGQ